MKSSLLWIGAGVLAITTASGANANTINISSTGDGSTVNGTVDPNWIYKNSSGVTAQALVANNPNVDFGSLGPTPGGAGCDQDTLWHLHRSRP
jgi:hypothetical protein